MMCCDSMLCCSDRELKPHKHISKKRYLGFMPRGINMKTCDSIEYFEHPSNIHHYSHCFSIGAYLFVLHIKTSTHLF